LKKTTILYLAVFAGLAALTSGCRSNRDIHSRREQRYPDRSVVVVNQPVPGNLPPGQAKKIYGDKSAKRYAPGQRKKYGSNYHIYPLIILRRPDIIIGRYNDGRNYYKDPEGFIYWEGYDDRFYLDKKYLSNIRYDMSEYKEWENKGRFKSNASDGNGNRNKGKGKKHD
jgi:hypothetical protein